MNRKLLLLLIVSTLIRTLSAAFTELGNDEAYYRIFALFPDWSYFDHPPMVSWLIHLTTFGAAVAPEVLIRLGSIIIGTVNTYIIYRIGRRFTDSQRGGLIAALIYTGSIYCSAIIGTFIMPDTPLSLFWLLSLGLFIEILPPNDDKFSNSKMLLAGLFVGLAMLAKYTGIYLWGAAGLYILLFNRKWLFRWSLYASVLITGLVFLPVIYWNWQNDFISFTFHGDRVGSYQGITWFLVGREVMGGILYNGVINVVVIYCAVIAWINGKRFINKESFWFCIIFSLPMILLFLGMSFRSETLPHWASPGYFALFILVAAYLNSLKKHPFTVATISATFLAIALLAGIYVVNQLPIQIGSQNTFTLGRNDPTLDMYGWEQGGTKFDSLHRQDTILAKDAPIIQDGWDHAAHFDCYFALPYGYQLKTIGNIHSVHYYKWITNARGGFRKGDSGYLVTTSNYPPAVGMELQYKDKFEQIMPADTLKIERAGRHIKSFFVYRMIGYKSEN